ncbi:MAG: hypothetical protein KF773_36165 [Deltaproteobacteria bacterium]|nr:hypothetical protein [Deltaproteobacteria bacterium]
MHHRLAALAAAISLTGCSFFLTQNPPERTSPPSAIPPECTAQMTWPTVDAIIAGLSIIAVVGAITQGEDTTRTENRGSAIASSLVLAGVAGAGAYVGHNRVKSCRFAQNEFNAAYYRNGGVPGQPPFAGGPNSNGYADAPENTPQQPRAYVPQGPQGPQGPQTPARPLATEGDVCNAEVVCGLGLVCASNLCVKPPPRK